MSTNSRVSHFQITLWDYVRYGVNDFLGETVIDLHNQPLDDEPEWFMLQPHQESNYPGGVRKELLMRPPKTFPKLFFKSF